MAAVSAAIPIVKFTIPSPNAPRAPSTNPVSPPKLSPISLIFPVKKLPASVNSTPITLNAELTALALILFAASSIALAVPSTPALFSNPSSVSCITFATPSASRLDNPFRFCTKPNT